MTTHTPTRWTTFPIALMMLVATACASAVSPPPVGFVDEDPPVADAPVDVAVIPFCPSRISGTFC